jgi:hypothetical protein
MYHLSTMSLQLDTAVFRVLVFVLQIFRHGVTNSEQWLFAPTEHEGNREQEYPDTKEDDNCAEEEGVITLSTVGPTFYLLVYVL